MVLDLFPNNLFMALAEGNIPQIMILACFLGFLMRNLDNQTDKLNTTMDDLYTVFLNAIEYSVSFLPLFIFASLTGLLWENEYHAERSWHSPEWTRDCQRSGAGVRLHIHRVVHCYAPYGDGNTGRPSESS